MGKSGRGVGIICWILERVSGDSIAVDILLTLSSLFISNSGNVVISEIDGPVVKLELQGACGSCPSSTMTMKMGLERRLREKIPEISEVGNVADRDRGKKNLEQLEDRRKNAGAFAWHPRSPLNLPLLFTLTPTGHPSHARRTGPHHRKH
jgi:Fe-S cluster biogenesis protein NfuA